MNIVLMPLQKRVNKNQARIFALEDWEPMRIQNSHHPDYATQEQGICVEGVSTPEKKETKTRKDADEQPLTDNNIPAVVLDERAPKRRRNSDHQPPLHDNHCYPASAIEERGICGELVGYNQVSATIQEDGICSEAMWTESAEETLVPPSDHSIWNDTFLEEGFSQDHEQLLGDFNTLDHFWNDTFLEEGLSGEQFSGYTEADYKRILEDFNARDHDGSLTQQALVGYWEDLNSQECIWGVHFWKGQEGGNEKQENMLRSTDRGDPDQSVSLEPGDDKQGNPVSEIQQGQGTSCAEEGAASFLPDHSSSLGSSVPLMMPSDTHNADQQPIDSNLVADYDFIMKVLDEDCISDELFQEFLENEKLLEILESPPGGLPVHCC